MARLAAVQTQRAGTRRAVPEVFRVGLVCGVVGAWAHPACKPTGSGGPPEPVVIIQVEPAHSALPLPAELRIKLGGDGGPEQSGPPPLSFRGVKPGTYPVRLDGPFMAAPCCVHVDAEGRGTATIKAVAVNEPLTFARANRPSPPPYDRRWDSDRKQIFLDVTSPEKPTIRWRQAAMVVDLQDAESFDGKDLATALAEDWRAHDDPSVSFGVIVVDGDTSLASIVRAADMMVRAQTSAERSNERSVPLVVRRKADVERRYDVTWPVDTSTPPATVQGGKPPTVQLGPISQHPVRLAEADVERVLTCYLHRVEHCYWSALATNRSLSGRVSVRFQVGRDGGTANVSGGGDITDGTFVSCVSRGIGFLSFPRPSDGTTAISSSFEVSPGRPARAGAR